MPTGIDYSGPGATCNRDSETGIRYGIIPARSLAHWVWDEFETEYWRGCGNCGTELSEDDEWACNADEETCCPHCQTVLEDDQQYGDEPNGHHYNQDGLKMSIDSSGDVWVFMSPLTIKASFCSPCAPGACHLESPCDDGTECYAVPRDWFDDESRCPYPIRA